MTSHDITTHLHDVDRILALGGTVPQEHHDLRARWIEFLGVEMHGMERLRSAVIEGTGKLEDAYRDAVTENAADGQMRVIIMQNIALAVIAAMRDQYATTAASNYATAADCYNATAKRLTDALAIVNPDAPESTMIGVPRKESDAYLSVPLVVLELDQHLDDLALAARLAGVYTINDETMRLPMAANVSDLHRRRVWEAWRTTTGRGGRWHALVKAGATLKATATVTDLAPYREPEPVQVTQVRIGSNGIRGYKRVETDPEDAEFALANGE